MEEKAWKRNAERNENRKMTEITENNMEFLTGEAKSPGQLVAFLKEGAMFRDFGCVLKEIYPKQEIASELARGLTELNGGDYEKTLRKVRNWLNGKNVPKNRELLFQICFILRLEEGEADRVLAAASDTGIHYRNPEELVYAYALRSQYTFAEAAALKGRVLELLHREQREGEDKGKPDSGRVYTNQIRDVFRQVSSEEELFEFFREQGEKLGYLHETAYEKFVELLNRLQKPEGSLAVEERKYTVDEVVQSYLRMNVPQDKRNRNDTLLQRLVKKYWPGTTSILNMRSRKEDVSRKVILLLYLITEEFDCAGEEAEDYYFEEEAEAPDTLLEIRLEKMNLFLASYGMNGLDPGSPFDFLALYAMKTQEGEYVSDRMEEALNVLFASGEDET